MSEAQMTLYLIAVTNVCRRTDLESLLRTHIDPGPLRRVVYGIILDRLTEQGPQ